MKSLTKHYDKLTADERARLFVAAAARRDVQELDRLNETCPRKSYWTEDRDYTRRKVNLWILTLAHHGDLGRLEFLAMVSLAALVTFEDSEDESAGEALEIGEEILCKALAAWNAKTNAWRRFCEEIDIESTVLQQGFNCQPNPLWSIVTDMAESLKLEIADDGEASDNALSCLRAVEVWDLTASARTLKCSNRDWT